MATVREIPSLQGEALTFYKLQLAEWQLAELLDGGWGDSTTGYLSIFKLHSHGFFSPYK